MLVSAPIQKLYDESSELKFVERYGSHRIDVRRQVAKLAPKSGIGAEIGVFTGLYSEVLAEITQPKKLFMVDPWEKLHGDVYPNWGNYSANIELPTAVAKRAATVRADSMHCDCEVIDDFDTAWLSGKDKPFLDWAYLDASHKYEDTLEQLQEHSEALETSSDSFSSLGNTDYGLAPTIVMSTTVSFLIVTYLVTFLSFNLHFSMPTFIPRHLCFMC